MRHRIKGRLLNRNSTHRKAMFRNMMMALVQHERITTTIPKAKELRPIVERIITLAVRGVKSGDRTKELHARRLILARLGPVAKATFHDNEGEPVEDKAANNMLNKLFKVLAPRFADRPGGYTRIMKLTKRRLGDAGETAIIELLKEGEVKVQASEKKAKASTPAPAPAPVVVAPAPQPEPEAAAPASEATETK